MAEAAATGAPYALVLLDAHLPNGDGPALAAHLRQQADAPVLVLMLASTDGPGDIAPYRELGVTALLTKPLLAAELRATLLSALGRAPAEPAADARAPVRPAAPALRILVVEDNPINQVVMMELLEKLGHTVVTASSGSEAMAALARQPFDAVLMDVQMPEMSGWEVTTQIREREHQTGRHLPIIGVTAFAMTGDRERCLEAGMDDYLAKPLQAPELVDALTRLVPAGARHDSRAG
jgi:CheY-like chemotaxis protein